LNKGVCPLQEAVLAGYKTMLVGASVRDVKIMTATLSSMQEQRKSRMKADMPLMVDS